MESLEPRPRCERCEKKLELCICAEIPQLPKTRVQVVILQHPQEPDKDLGSARLAQLCLPGSVLKVGLSWPNLSKAVGFETQHARWAVLYLGSGIQGEASKPKPGSLVFVDKKTVATDLLGIVVLDGTWSQAKTLWWRNPWMLKLKRAILVPSQKSLYGDLRHEPRRECLSTLETIAECLTVLGEPKKTDEALRAVFSQLLDKYRALPRPAKPKKDWRRRRSPQRKP